MQHDSPWEALQQPRDLFVRVAAVNDHRKVEVRCELELCREEPALRIRRSPVAVEVETGLADGHRPAVGKEAAKLPEARRVAVAGLVRMDAQSTKDPRLPLGQSQSSPAGLDAGADGNDPGHAGLACTGDQRLGRRRAGEEAVVTS